MNRIPRNKFSGQDVTGKIIQNALVLQRIRGLHPYGRKISDLCACIDIKKDNGVIYFRLNTQFAKQEDVKPFNGL